MRKKWLLVIFLVLGLALRMYHWETGVFGFDQVQIATEAEKISHGDITLIGPRTGPAPMFTGPLIYYVAAGWWLIWKGPVALCWTTWSIALLTGIIGWLLVRRASTTSMANAAVGVWALAPLLINFDRVSWNPNFTVLAASLCFFPLVRASQVKRWEKWEYLSLALGAFLGYQAHFSGLLLPALSLIGLLIIWRRLKKEWWLSLISLVGGLSVSLVPTVLFDVRHQWYNFTGLLSILQNTSSGAGATRIQSWVQAFWITWLNIGRMVTMEYGVAPTAVAGLAVVCLLGYHWYTHPAHRSLLTTSTVWLVVSALLLGFYRQDKPEYYFLLQVPAVWLCLSSYAAHLATTAKGRQQLALVVGVWLVATSTAVMMRNSQLTGVSWGNQHLALNQVKNYLAQGQADHVVFDAEAVHTLGLRYFLSREGLTAEKGSRAVHIQYPYYVGTVTSTHFNDLGVWLDPRTDSTLTYISRPTYTLGFSKNLELWQRFDWAPAKGNDAYSILNQTKLQAILVVATKTVNPEWYKELERVSTEQTGGAERSWQPLQFEGREVLVYRTPRFIIWLEAQATLPTTISELRALSTQLTFIE